MALSDAYFDCSQSLREETNLYFECEVFDYSENDKKRAGLICDLLEAECKLLDRMGDGIIGGNPEELIKFIQHNSESKEYVENYNAMLENLKIKV